MHIVIVVPYGIEQSGVIVFMSRLEGEFVRKGITTTLLFKGSSTKWMGKTIRNFKTNKELSTWLFQENNDYDILFWAGLYQEQEEVNRQILDSIMLRKQFGKRVYLMWERTGRREVLSDPTMLRLLVDEASNGIIALNDEQARELEELSVPAHLIHISSPGIDTRSEFRPSSLQERHQIRQELGWADESVIVLFVGRFVKRKRPDFLIKAWLQDKTLEGKAHLLLVGSGFGHKLSIEKEVYSLANMSTSICIIPHDGESDRSRFYRAADIMVLPGISEGEPSVLSESLACGLPVVASNIPGHIRLVHQSQTGLLFEADDMAQLCEALCTLIYDKDYRQRLGKAARKIAVQHRDISVVADKLLNFFNKGTTIDQTCAKCH